MVEAELTNPNRDDSEELVTEPPELFTLQKSHQPDPEITLSHKQEWNGLKIIGDNVDKNVRPYFQRITQRTLLLPMIIFHYRILVKHVDKFRQC